MTFYPLLLNSRYRCFDGKPKFLQKFSLSARVLERNGLKMVRTFRVLEAIQRKNRNKEDATVPLVINENEKHLCK